MKLKNIRLLFKKLICFLLTGLIFPAVILAQEFEGVLLTGLSTNSGDTREQEVLKQGVAKTFNVRLVWTYDQTDIITGPLEAFAAAKDIASPVNGLEEPLLSEISGYQHKVIAHSAATITAVSLAKQGKLWGDVLYVVSPILTSQEDLRIVRDLVSEGKGFKEIVVYSGDDIIPNFKKVYVNFSDYSNEIKITETWSFSVKKLIYEDRRQEVDLLETFLGSYSNLVKETIGKTPISITTYGDFPGNKFEIEWEDGIVETFYLQTDAQTGEDFHSEEGITVIPQYKGFPHGRVQLEVLAEFLKKYERIPGIEDLTLFKHLFEEYLSKTESFATTARDPNEKLVSPEGYIMPGGTLDYTINYENEGEGIAYGVYITDTLDEDLDDTTLIVEDDGSYDPDTRTISWFIGEVGSGEEGSVNFSINVKEDTPETAEIINFATVYFPSVPEVTRTNGAVNPIITAPLDTTPPSTAISLSPSANQAGWNNTDVTINLTAVDNSYSSGVKEIHYKLTGAVTKEEIISGQTAEIILTTEGATNLTYWAEDNAGNIETAKSFQVKIDKTPPTLTYQTSPQPNSYGWNNTDVTVTFTATDTLSGVASIADPVTTITEGANQHVGGEVVDIAGNITTTYATLNIDKTPPQVSINTDTDLLVTIIWPPNHKMVDITIGGSATDNLSGIAQTIFNVEDEYNLVEPTITDFNTTIQLEAWRDGEDYDGRYYVLSVTATDKADNTSFASTEVICPHDQGQ